MDPTLAEIRLFAGNFAPVSWAICNGALMPISGNEALFSLIGTTYGGDGQQTFALPDLRGRVPVGTGQGAGLSYVDLGQVWGTESFTLTTANMPVHSHTSGPITVSINASTDSGNNDADKAYWAVSDNKPYDEESGNVAMAANATQITMISNNTGGGVPIGNMQPYLALNYIIAIEGIYPSRQ